MIRQKLFLGKNTIDIAKTGTAAGSKMFATISAGGTELADLTAYAVGSDYTFHDLNDILPAYAMPLPDFGEYIELNVDAIRKISLAYSQPNGFQSSGSFYALLGAGRSAYITRGIDYSLRLPIPFLTNQPVHKKTSTTASEWLFLPLSFQSSPPTSVTLIATATSSSGSITTVALRNLAAIVNHSILCIDVSTYRVLADLPADTVSYTIHFVDQAATVLSETRYYYIEPPYEESYSLVFRNSLNTWDTLTFEGNEVRAVHLEHRRLSVRNVISTFEVSAFETIKHRVSDLDVNWIYYLKELTMSPDIYLVENGLHKILFTASSMDILDTSKPTEGIELNFRLAATENVY